MILAVGNDAYDEGEFLLPQDEELSYKDFKLGGDRQSLSPNRLRSS